MIFCSLPLFHHFIAHILWLWCFHRLNRHYIESHKLRERARALEVWAEIDIQKNDVRSGWHIHSYTYNEDVEVATNNLWGNRSAEIRRERENKKWCKKLSENGNEEHNHILYDQWHAKTFDVFHNTSKNDMNLDKPSITNRSTIAWEEKEADDSIIAYTHTDTKSGRRKYERWTKWNWLKMEWHRLWV